MSHTSNLLVETQKHMDIYGKTLYDITYIGSKCGYKTCTWDEFRTLADKEYIKGGFDEVAIATDLIIVFRDKSIMYRNFDAFGLEGWDIIDRLNPVPHTTAITNIFTNGNPLV